MKALLVIIAVGCGVTTVPISASRADNVSLTNEVSPYGRAIYKATTWGAQTNGIQFGACISSVGPHPSDQLKVFTFLGNTLSTNRYGLLIPPHGYCLDLSLHDKGGKVVPRTRAGSALCNTVPADLRSTGHHCSLLPGVPMRFDDPFDLRKCFAVTEPGTYILTVKGRLFVLKAYPGYARIDLPATQVNVVVTPSDLERTE